MPENELRTRITIDTDSAENQMNGLMATADQKRVSEVAAQEKMIRDLSTMSVEEFNKQITAQETLLERLRLSQTTDASAERERKLREYKLREDEFKERISNLDVEANKILQMHADKLAQLDLLRKVKSDDANADKERIEAIKALEQEVADVIDKGRINYKKRTEEAYQMEKSRLDTFKDIAGVGTDPDGGGVDAVSGGGGLSDSVSSGMKALDSASNKLKSVLAPFMRILGVTGIAFSLEQVVEKLYKANAELRTIRNNYADIAASMGDMVSAGSGAFALNSGAMMDMQRTLMLRYADAIDEKLIPTITKSLQKGGFAPEDMAGLTETSLLMGVGAGVNPQEIGSLFAKLYKEFSVPREKLAEETNAIINAAHNLRVPFEDLTKWTLSLAEQTRVYGFDLEDSRKLVSSFAHEIEKGTVQLSNLVKLQNSMSQLDMSTAMGISQFLPQIIKGMGDLGGSFGAGVRGSGDPMEQAGFIQAAGQGQLPANVLTRILKDDKLRESYGGTFDVGTQENPGTGALLPGMGNLSGQLMQGIKKFAEASADESGGGAFQQQQVMVSMLKMLGVDLTGKPIKEQNELLSGLEDGSIAMRDMLKDLKDPTEKTVDELKKLADGMLEDRASMSGKIQTGISWWWRDSSESIVSAFSRFMGDDAADVQARMKTRVGASTIAGFSRGIEGFDMGDVTQSLSGEQLLSGIKGARGTGIGSWEEQRDTIKDLLQFLSKSGRIDGIDIDETLDASFGSEKQYKKAQALYQKENSTFLGHSVSGAYSTKSQGDLEKEALFNLQTDAMRVAPDIRRGILSGSLVDTDTKTKGVQIKYGSLNINLGKFEDISSVRTEIETKFDEFNKEVLIPQTMEAIRQNNASGSGQ